jgi:hypothetical protein
MDAARAALLVVPFQDWKCPACGLEERTRPYPPNAARMHTCPRLHMILAPMAPAAADCTVVAVERADYLGREIQETGDDGRPYMAMETRYADGRNDVAVHAPVARASLADIDPA